MDSPVPVMIFGYTCLLHVGLPAISAFLFGDEKAPLRGFAVERLLPTDLASPAAQGAYVVAIVAVALGVVAPRLYRARAKGSAASKVLVPFMLRHIFFETCTVAGFALSFIEKEPFAILPFALVGLAGSLSAPPRQAQIDEKTSLL